MTSRSPDILYGPRPRARFPMPIATTAEEGLAVAVQYLPSAVVLDIGLPDHSGLSVLDRLKHDARTRHIPVHVVSGRRLRPDGARSLGAVGYMLKPVKREELVGGAASGSRRGLTQRMRRVLVVEDDPVQLESLRQASRLARRGDRRRRDRRRVPGAAQGGDVRLHGARPDAAGRVRVTRCWRRSAARMPTRSRR